ncbi:DUF1833 family protein [Roseateles sp.]|uniref:DUF1833 family protein n=1 Tax=Roseateles sp. TaxID=1971397 RepID=UPI0031D3ECC7
MDRRTYWATKSPLPTFHAITFEHPAFDAPIRLVANQYQPVTLGGNVFTPAGMTIKAPDKKSDAQPKLTIAFSREKAGREFKRQMRRIAGSLALTSIAVTYEVYLADTDAPQVTWSLFVAESNGIAFSNDQVQVTATIDNPMRRDVGPIYDPAVFTGLEIL